MDILELITKKDVVDFSENYEYKTGTMGSTLFPKVKTDNLKVAYQAMLSTSNLPVIAQVTAFNTEARIGDRMNFETKELEKFLIKEKLDLGEKHQYYLSNGVTDHEAIKNFIFDDASNLVSRVLNRVEVADMQVFSTGKLTVKENNLDFEIDYQVPTDNFVDMNNWSDPSHDILADLAAIKLAAINVGKKINAAVTSTKVMGYLAANTAIKDAFYAANPTSFLDTDLVAGWLETFVKITFRTNDELYKTSALTTETSRFFPEDVISFFDKATAPGAGFYCKTPREFAPTNAVTRGFVTLDNYLQIGDPVGTWTIAEAVYVPLIKDAAGLFIATVKSSN